MKSILSLLLVALVGTLSAATTFTGTGVSADVNVDPLHSLSVSISGTFVATIYLDRAVSGGYVPVQSWTAGVTFKPPGMSGIYRLRCSDFTSGTVTYVLSTIAANQVIYRKPDGSTAFSVDVDGLVTSAGGAVSGGTINNTVIGGTTPAAGTFTTLFATSVSGPTIDNAIIGGTTPAAGSFTTLTATSTYIGSGTLTVNKDSDYSGNVGGLTTKGVTAPNATVRIGVTTTPVYFIQANLDGTGSRPLALNPGGGNVLIGTATDDGTNKLQVSGTGTFAGTTDSTTAATGTIIDTGGLGVAKNIVAKQGLGIGVASTVTAAGTTALTTASAACQVFTGTTTQTMTLPAANAFGAGIAYVVYVKNLSTGVVTVSRAGSDTINSTAANVTTFTLAQWASVTLYSDGVSAWERF